MNKHFSREEDIQMTKRHEKMLITDQRKNKSKSQRNHVILVRKAIIKNTITSVGEDVEKSNACALLVGI